MNLKYCDYDFSKMKDPKGGFILEEQSAPTEEEERKKEREMIDKRNLLEANPVCESCESPGEIDTNFLYYFGVPVCNSCRKSNSERYSLLTKTECRKDYLLTEGELRDASRLPTWRRPNPHGSTYSDMLLYMRSQVEQFAREKWGSLDNIDRECQLRSEKKAKAKRDKRTRKISELRRRTRISTGKFAPAPDSHMHTFECVSYDPGTSESVRRCTGCGLIQSMEKI